MVGGQADDLAAEVRPAATSRRWNRSIAARPGRCSASSLRLGGLVAGARRRSSRVRLHAYGRRLGLAFQIIDDLLDVHGDEAALGKRVGKDSRPRQADLSRACWASRKAAAGPEQLIDEACAALVAAWGIGPSAWKRWPATCWKGIARWTRLALEDRLAARPAGALACRSSSSWPREMRDVLCNLRQPRAPPTSPRTWASSSCAWPCTPTFDFRRDRLIWDTGHQIYPHKLITGRYHEFGTIRTKGGLMGYPNPHESDYDLFMTGHAGCSVSTALGPDERRRPARPARDRHARRGHRRRRVPLRHRLRGAEQRRRAEARSCWSSSTTTRCRSARASAALADYLDRLRMNPFYSGLKQRGRQASSTRCRCSATRPSGSWRSSRKRVKAGLHGGMLFEDLGFRYFGPIDGHNIAAAAQVPADGQRRSTGPMLLHVVTEKGHGFQPAADDPVFFHTPPPFERQRGRGRLAQEELGSRGLHATSPATRSTTQMAANPRVTVLTAAMCQGNKLETVRDAFPDRFFDTGICEVARRGLRRRPGQGRPAADRRHLQHVPAAELRPDLPGSRPAEPAGDVHARPRRPDRARRPDASRRVRHRPTCASSRTWS